MHQNWSEVTNPYFTIMHDGYDSLIYGNDSSILQKKINNSQTCVASAQPVVWTGAWVDHSCVEDPVVTRRSRRPYRPSPEPRIHADQRRSTASGLLTSDPWRPSCRPRRIRMRTCASGPEVCRYRTRRPLSRRADQHQKVHTAFK